MKNMELIETVIESERLIQRPISEDDAAAVFKFLNDDVTQYMYPKKAEKIDETLSFIRSSIASMKKNTNLQLVVLKKENLEFIGCSGLHNIGKKDPELGIWIKKEAHGNKYGLEAVSAIVNWAQKNVDFEYMKYPVDKRNLASRNVAEKNGGIIKKEYKEMNLNNFELDEVEYWIFKICP